MKKLLDTSIPLSPEKIQSILVEVCKDWGAEHQLREALTSLLRLLTSDFRAAYLVMRHTLHKYEQFMWDEEICPECGQTLTTFTVTADHGEFFEPIQEQKCTHCK